MACKITKEEFYILHELILEKHIEKCRVSKRPKNNTSALYGFYEYDPEEGSMGEWSVKGLMLKDKYISQHVNAIKKERKGPKKVFSGRHLYDIWAKFKDKSKKQHTLKPPYEYAFFKFIGCENGYKQFKKDIYPKQRDLKWTKFTGYYFSEIDLCVKTFKLETLFSISGAFYPAIERGIHRINPNDSETVFEGIAEHNQNHLFIDLEDKEARKLNFICYVGGGDLKNLTILSGSFQGISISHTRPITGECILLNDTFKIEKANSRNELIQEIYLFLMLRRNHFWTNQLLKPQDLSGYLQRFDDTFIDLKNKVFRIWNFSLKEGLIMQSHFEIKSDYQSVLISPIKKSGSTTITKVEQTCLLYKSTIGGVKLCVLSFRKGSKNIMNYAIINISKPDQNGIYEGVFTTVGIKPSTGVISSYMVLIEDDLPFEAKELILDDINDLSNDSDLYLKLKDKLLHSLGKMKNTSSRILDSWLNNR